MMENINEHGMMRCGEQHGRFYDRKGDYFREGVDPRNYHGRLVGKPGHNGPSRMKPHSGWTHDYDCPAGFSDQPCDCGDLANG